MMRLYHAVSVDALVGLEFATGHANEDQDHGLRYQEMWSARRTGHRNATMQASQSTTSTSTVRRGGLSTSTVGSWERVSQNDWITRSLANANAYFLPKAACDPRAAFSLTDVSCA
ncbi:MAG: hypothetical protein ACK6DC_17645 [Planctomycetota bacterium]